jgi:DNA end-binding protein Ku
MPRAIWSGAISFGLVNVPVRMYSAIDTGDLEFDLLHVEDGGRIGYRKICKLEDEAVPDDEIVKGYEVDEGEYVYVTDEDFAAAEAEGYRTITIEDFVPYEEIDPIYFERTYYLGPQDGSEKVYALLRRAMEDSGLAGIARYVMRNREHLGCLRIREGVITLEKMYFADEIRPIDEIEPGNVKVGAKELEMAAELIAGFSGKWKPDRYRDTYRDRLLDIIKKKRKGKDVHAEAVREPEPPADLVEALQASVEAAKTRQRRTRASGTRRRSTKRKSTGRKPSRR